jgi:hypothetical protein
VPAQAGNAALAAATASSMSRSVAAWKVPSWRVASLGLVRVKAGPSVRGWPPTTVGNV